MESIKKMPASERKQAIVQQICNPDYNHEYLIKKGISFSELQSHTTACIKIHRLILYRELINLIDEHQGFERIWPDGTKKVTYGGTVKGSFTPFGFSWRDRLTLQGTLIVCAGLADGYRIHTATGFPVACGVGENNLKSIADPLFIWFGRAHIVVAADNDAPGIRAAKATGRRWIVPGEASHVA
ncbi:toprim domain-containing protein [Kushneria sp. TE3]|uniref:toprim domain-containing protein n=1 Tax=Kushneria sp. TE3 TaxID=3449832 RepID=UPI003F686D25